MSKPYRFCLLAPVTCGIRNRIPRHRCDLRAYTNLLTGMQALRGQTYLADGAIGPKDLDENGGLSMSDDECCWHLLLTQRPQRVIGCVSFRVHHPNVTFHQLRVCRLPVAQDPVLGPKLRRAIDAELFTTRQQGLTYVEVSGWALDPEWRRSKAAAHILAGSFALGEIWGGCRGLATATVRHSSASMLRRMGAESLQIDGDDFPAYHDIRYGCTMELLRFERHAVDRFAPLVEDLRRRLLTIPAIFPRTASPAVA